MKIKHLKINKNIVIVLSVLVFALLLLFIIFKKGSSNQIVVQNVFDVVELKSQADFKMLGEILFQGGGFEPGFNIKISLAGKKFGSDLVSKNGDTRYVGYIDLVNQSTTTKVFGGMVLDKESKPQEMVVIFTDGSCTMPSGETVNKIVKIKVSDEELTGCAR